MASPLKLISVHTHRSHDLFPKNTWTECENSLQICLSSRESLSVTPTMIMLTCDIEGETQCPGVSINRWQADRRQEKTVLTHAAYGIHG